MRSETKPEEQAIVVYSDIACPWARIIVHRLHRARRDVGADTEIAVDHRAFPLELVNDRPTDKRLLDAELPVCMELEPDARWSLDPRPWEYPVSTLPALEAVQAAKAQGAALSEQLDLALRDAMFGDWRCISVFPVVLDVAATVDDLDPDALWAEIESGRPRAEVLHHHRLGHSDAIPGSPTLVLPDGSVHHNPGIEFHWDDAADGRPIVDEDDRGAVADLVGRALAARPSD